MYYWEGAGATFDDTAKSVVPKHDIAILSQEIDNEDGKYRVRAGQRIHYVTILTGVFDDDTMCRPYLLIPKLPDLPDAPWTRLLLTPGTPGTPGQDGGNNNAFQSTFSSDPLPAVETTWHHHLIDNLSLTRVKRLGPGVDEVLYDDGRLLPAVAKFARFEWEIPRIEQETWAYSVIAEHAANEDESQPPAVTPRFLGHLTENGRVMGFLVEKLKGRFASIDDLPRCEEALQRLHSFGLVHGDINRYNFVVSSDCVRLLDLEHASEYEEELGRLELEALPSELAEDTGRGSKNVR
ncbi:hypothetical protein QBC46DRAFT_372769 [Diplogelasinospora grovesii]|uniref:Alpha-galactosidase A n=1 Tax=Diplogelasinospora grovesii TaxID=303347 RepID=A0AAN6NK67_9PEZI|nr:hypothetical protein QBC46DRAFT_372769 [Diplogelasinospora grovesii]